MRLLIAIAALMACSGAWAWEDAPQGWKAVDLVCTGVKGDRWYQQDSSQHDVRYYAATNGYGRFVGKSDREYWSTPTQVGADQYISGSEGRILAWTEKVDRSTGRKELLKIELNELWVHDCELRRENKF